MGLDVDYYINYKVENREGDDYLTIDTSTADFNCEMVYIDIKNIFGDNNELGESYKLPDLTPLEFFIWGHLLLDCN